MKAATIFGSIDVIAGRFATTLPGSSLSQLTILVTGDDGTKLVAFDFVCFDEVPIFHLCDARRAALIHWRGVICARTVKERGLIFFIIFLTLSTDFMIFGHGDDFILFMADFITFIVFGQWGDFILFAADFITFIVFGHGDDFILFMADFIDCVGDFIDICADFFIDFFLAFIVIIFITVFPTRRRLGTIVTTG